MTMMLSNLTDLLKCFIDALQATELLEMSDIFQP